MSDFPLGIIPAIFIALYFIIRASKKKKKVTPAAPRPGGQFKRYGYSVGLSSHFVPEKGSSIPADLRASYPDAGYFFAIPLFLPEWPVSSAAISAGFLRCFEIGLSDSNLRMQRELKHTSGLLGHEFAFLRSVDNIDYNFLIHIYHGQTLAYLLAAISIKPEAREHVHRMLDTVDFHEASRPESFTEMERDRHGEIYNNIGLYCFQNGDIHSALNFFQSSVNFKPADPSYLSNYSIALERMEKSHEALNMMRERLQRQEFQIFPSDTDMQSDDNWGLNLQEVFEKRRSQIVPLYIRLSILEARYGDRQKSQKIFSDAHEKYPEHLTEEALVEQMRLLEVENKSEAAISLAQAFIERTGSIQVLIALSELHRRAGEAQRALKLLERRRNETYFNGDLAFERIQALLDASRFRDVVDFCQELDARMQFRSGLLYYKKAVGEVALGLYREAKASLEKALQHSPGNPDIQSFLQQTSAMLGEGQNLELKNPIPEAPLPDLDISQNREEDGADILYHLCARVFELEPGEALRVSDHIHLEICTASGAQQFQSFQFVFNPLVESIFVNRARVHSPDGSMQDTDVSEMYTMDKKDPGMASDDRLLNVSLPGITIGSKVEIVISRRKKDDSAEFPFEEYYFSRSAPVQLGVFAVRGFETSLKELKSCHSVDVEARHADGLRVWVSRQLALFFPETGGVPIREIVPFVAVCGLRQSWEEQALEYREKMEPKLTPAGEEQKILDWLGVESLSVENKIQVLYDFVQTQIQYKAIEFGRRAREAAPAASTLARKYGDCKDMSVLLCNLLKLAGVPAEPALLHSATQILLDLPSLDQFNHMVVVTGDGHVLDPANKFHGPELQPPMNLGKKSLLVLDKSAPHFLHTPDYGNGSGIRIVRRVSPAGEGDVLVEEEVTHQGYYAGFLREELLNVPANYRESVWISRFEREGYQIQSVQLPANLHSSGDIGLSWRYLVQGVLKMEQDHAIMNLPGLTELNFIRPGSFKLHKFPFQFEYGLTVSSRTSFHLDGVQLARPLDYRSMPDLNFQAEFILKQEGRELVADYACQVRPGRYHPEQIDGLSSAALAALEPFARGHRINRL
ncbi:MAG: DUF3857 domain-containing protein [Spirochaetales bacterium]|nr:DUF3857 domain-containing protein [Spirochaetales bacterium]